MRNPRHCVNYSLCRGEVVKQGFCTSCKGLIRLLGQIHADDGRRPLGVDGRRKADRAAIEKRRELHRRRAKVLESVLTGEDR